MVNVLTPAEAGAVLKVSPSTVLQLCREGRIPGAIKVGRQWRIPEEAIAAMFLVPPPSAPQPAADAGMPAESDLARVLRKRLARQAGVR